MGFSHNRGRSMPLHREIVEPGIVHVPENRRLFPRMTVEDNFRMGGFVPTSKQQLLREPVTPAMLR
jgi:ABC-type branched-subunit amino acid transport system ATPase component